MADSSREFDEFLRDDLADVLEFIHDIHWTYEDIPEDVVYSSERLRKAMQDGLIHFYRKLDECETAALEEKQSR